MAIVQSPESQNVEFKESWRDEYLKWVCGFANASGGYIYIGVVDGSHEIVGVADSKRLMEDIPNKIVNSLGIVADVNLRQADGLDYIEIIVTPSNIPISYKGVYHYRSGSTKQELKGAALQDFLLRKLGKTWDDVSNEEAHIEDIDRDAIEYFLRKGMVLEVISGNSARLLHYLFQGFSWDSPSSKRPSPLLYLSNGLALTPAFIKYPSTGL